MLCQYGFLSQDVLLNVVEPPSEEAMDNAMQRLQDVGALDEEEVREMERENERTNERTNFLLNV